MNVPYYLIWSCYHGHVLTVLSPGTSQWLRMDYGSTFSFNSVTIVNMYDGIFVHDWRIIEYMSNVRVVLLDEENNEQYECGTIGELSW